MKKIIYKNIVGTPGGKAYLVFLGDVHYGAKNCDVKMFEGLLKWLKKTKNAYVLGMGDMLDVGTKDSVGGSVYDQEEFVQGQLEKMVDYLSPIAKSGRLIGLIDGNHEQRISKRTGLNLTKVMSQMLDTDYLGYSTNLRLRVGGETYKVHATHGDSGAMTVQGKLKKCLDLQLYNDADIFAMGHVHELMDYTKVVNRQNPRHMSIENFDIHFLLTGSYLKYFDGYAESKGYSPARLGTPIVELGADGRLINVIYYEGGKVNV